MSKETRNNGHSEGCVCELFTYLPKLVAYPHISDINKLTTMLIKDE